MTYTDYFDKLFQDTHIKAREGFIYSYRGKHMRFDTRIQVDIFYMSGDINLVIMCDLGDGVSVTNASEDMATGIRRLKGLDPHKTLWAEVYFSDVVDGIPKDWLKKNLFDQITYEYDADTDEYHKPVWSPIHPTALPESLTKQLTT